MIKVNVEKAKQIAHDKRRAVRSEKYAPLDIEATIPTMADEAEAKRAVIRTADAQLQVKIDDAVDADELKAVLSELEG